MVIGKLRSSLLFLLTLFMGLSLQAQEQKRISFNCFSGVTILPLKDKLNASGQATNIFGKYPPAITFGAGVNYRLNDRYSWSNNLFYLFTSKSNYSFSASGLKTSLKFSPFSDVKKFSPYVSVGLNLDLVNINRKKYTTDFAPDSTANVIGSGIGVTKITYNYDKLKLSFVPMPGAAIGAGVACRLSNKVNLFFDYTYNYNLANLSSLMKDNYFYNKANLNYHFATAGVTIKLLKPMKQMLATLHKKEWDGDPTITVRGVLIYKKERRSNEKVVPIEMTDFKDTVLAVIPTDKMGTFEYKNLRPEDYKFMLAKRNKKIIRADLQIIHDNTRISIFEEYPELEMIEDYESNNIITRDNNFSVILREGFQHEVDITVLGNSVIGKVRAISYDTLCRNLLVLLKNKYDSTIAVTEPSENCLFTFPDVEQGQHKIVFVRKDIIKNDVKFSYSFEENPPVIRRQYNTDEDTMNYEPYSVAIPEEVGVSMDEILLSRRYEKRIGINETFTSLNSGGARKNAALPGSIDKETVIKDESVSDVRGNSTVGNADSAEKVMEVESMIVKEDEKNSNNDSIEKVIEVNNKEINPRISDLKNIEEKAIANDSFNNDTIIKNEKLNEENNHDVNAEEEDIVEKKIFTLQEMKLGYSYSIQGEEKDLKGYGVQVGAFKSDEFARKFCEKFSKRRTEALYIQVISSQSENSYHAKLYRVIVGEYPDIETATVESELLKKSGYDTVIRRHQRFVKNRH